MLYCKKKLPKRYYLPSSTNIPRKFIKQVNQPKAWALFKSIDVKVCFVLVEQIVAIEVNECRYF